VLSRYGAAILDACKQLNERLAPLKQQLGPDAAMADIAAMAWMNRIDLCAHGFYKTPDITGEPACIHLCVFMQCLRSCASCLFLEDSYKSRPGLDRITALHRLSYSSSAAGRGRFESTAFLLF
jgi:hypothetical protein